MVLTNMYRFAKHKMHKQKLPVLLCIICCVAGASLLNSACAQVRLVSDRKDYHVNITNQLKPIQKVDPAQYPDSLLAYFCYYGLVPQDDSTQHLFGTFDSQNQTLAAHIYIPQDYKATVVLLHGYLNHSGQFKHLIKRLLRENYAVALYDLPGHGLSTGPRGQINDFDQYTNTLNDFIETIKTLTKGPYHLVGFSTGGGIAVDYLLNTKKPVFDKVVLAAPLIRNNAWKASKAGCEFYSQFSQTVPRIPRRNSSDKQFLRFNREMDVLHGRSVGLKWVKALHEWNDKINPLPPVEKPVYIIQGDKDTTVLWKYNVKFLKKKFLNARVEMVKNARHELFNEAQNIRENVLKLTTDYLCTDNPL
jgi:alpha-beta hydrolase superfamily lysophospholipase